MVNIDILLWQKIWLPNGLPWRTSGSPGRFIGRLGRPDDLLYHTLKTTNIYIARGRGEAIPVVASSRLLAHQIDRL